MIEVKHFSQDYSKDKTNVLKDTYKIYTKRNRDKSIIFCVATNAIFGVVYTFWDDDGVERKVKSISEIFTLIKNNEIRKNASEFYKKMQAKD